MKPLLMNIFQLIGGLALFIYGMNMLSDVLKQAATGRLRVVIAAGTRRWYQGFGLGNLLGILVRSSTATVTLVGFVNAGLLGLRQGLPVVLGANIGASLSMQLVSFKLGAYCYAAIGSGFLISLVGRKPPFKHVGMVLMGFGVILLGLNLMSGAVVPYREALKPFLAMVDGREMSGLLIGIGISVAVTALIQSSGAVIGICFAFLEAGAFGSMAQAYPIILGAHIGTCATALLGSLGARAEAKRVAFGHLSFNLFNVGLGIAFAAWFIQAAEWSASDPLRQAANVHTIIMVVAALLALPFLRPWEWLLRLVIRSRIPEERSHLDESFLQTPEQAMAAAVRELKRMSVMCQHSLRDNFEMLLLPDRKRMRSILNTEQVLDETKEVMRHYLRTLSGLELSRRQSLMIQHLSLCMNDLERIGDLLETMGDISRRRYGVVEARFNKEALDRLYGLYHHADAVLEAVCRSFDKQEGTFEALGQQILEAREKFVRHANEVRDWFSDEVLAHRIPSIAGLYYSDYLNTLERIVRHAKHIGQAEESPQFLLKERKMERVSEEVEVDPIDPIDDAEPFLELPP